MARELSLQALPSGRPNLPLSSYEPLSTQDQLFLMCDRPTTPMHVGMLLVLEKGLPLRRGGGVDIERFRQHVAARLDTIPRYRKYLAYTPVRRLPVWVDDAHFDVSFHVRHLALPRPGNQGALKALCGELLAQPLNPSKPLWDMHVIEGLRGGRTAVLAKAHHCLVDGVRGAHMLEVLLDLVQSEVQAQLPSWTARQTPQGLDLLRCEIDGLWSTVSDAATAFQDWVRRPGDALTKALEAAADLTEVLRLGLESAATSPLNMGTGAGRKFDCVAMDLSALKAIKNRLGGTLNDVVLAVVAGALRRFFINQRNVKWPRDLRVLVPVNRRSSDEGLACGNFIGGMMINLPISTADPTWRYRLICRRTAEAKQSRQAAGAELLSNAGSALLGVGVELIDRVRPFNLVVSNIPGPQLPLYFAGAPVEALFPVVPLFTGQGASIGLFSYDGRLFWGINADAQVLPDVGQLARAISASFKELYDACHVEELKTAERRLPISAITNGQRARRTELAQAASA